MCNSDQIKVADALRKSWVYRLLPQSLWPYAQLARWERPIGWQLLLWPGLWSLGLASLMRIVANNRDPDPLLGTSVLIIVFALMVAYFFIGAIVMRGAGCTFNDLADHDIDAQVARTCSRPLPSGRVTKKQAYIFLLAQLLVGLVILLQLNNFAIWLGAASLITIAIYPFMKRITWWPQLFLGFAFSWGALLGWAAITGSLGLPPLLLYLGSIAWVIGYDTIYAHQDKEDDALVGVKSTARLFGEKSKTAITILYSIAILFFGAAVYFTLPGDFWVILPVYLALIICAGQMFWQIQTLDINNPHQCLALFKSNNNFGWIFFSGIIASIVVSGAQ
ncbi:MAG: 4-hydroxybenzoate octaprenyltransferase [Rhizobiaceae bacterium]|nr:4-hydroxybenzoate octaprenyltransferase [Rhizobiaceae bacterium]